MYIYILKYKYNIHNFKSCRQTCETNEQASIESYYMNYMFTACRRMTQVTQKNTRPAAAGCLNSDPTSNAMNGGDGDVDVHATAWGPNIHLHQLSHGSCRVPIMCPMSQALAPSPSSSLSLSLSRSLCQPVLLYDYDY